ncbi:glycosyl hydrolase [Cohnella soli]|uniref:Glycosyl hydrolase n=1 Tax=Cohnella soli TaxID=425005 RepID=A0ABW0HSP6_9BACL
MGTASCEWLGEYRNPSAKYRPVPFWALNGEHDAQEMKEQLKRLQVMGMGGGFFHPRPGLVNEYFSEEWFDLFAAALEEAEKQGLHLYIYDENSYPSGFGGGHVSAELPDCLSRAAVQTLYENIDAGELPYAKDHFLASPGRPIAAYAFERTPQGGMRLTKSLSGLPASEWGKYGRSFAVYDWQPAETNSWLGGFAYVDLLRPEVVRKFIELTHERYKERFGDRFGTTIPAVFTDEPEVSPGNMFRQDEVAIPFSYWFAAQFADRTGYDLIEHLPLLFQEAEDATGNLRDAREVRYDFYEIMYELWKQNYVVPLSEWCVSNGLALTGHYLEHQWPIPWVRFSPGIMSLYEYMSWPGIDFLTCSPLEQDGKDPLLVAVREAASAAHQLGKERTLCEAFGAGGFDSSTQDYKRIGDWLLVHGINFLNPHLTAGSLAGARKRDHPQSFDWRVPWQYELRQLNDYFARAQLALMQGEPDRRVLLLHPTRTSYLYPATASWNAAGQPFEEMVSGYKELLQQLSDAGIDYDLGDEEIMARHGRVADGKWTVGRVSYDEVILPAGMETIKASTLRLLAEFVEAGGTVRVLGGSLPNYVDGRKSSAVRELAERKPAGWERTSVAALIERWSAESRRSCGYALREIGLESGSAVTASVSAVSAAGASTIAVSIAPAITEVRGLGVQSRVLPGGDRLLFLAYSAPEPKRVSLALFAKMAAVRLDLLQGTAEQLASGDQELLLEQGSSHCFLLVNDASSVDRVSKRLSLATAQKRVPSRRDEEKRSLPIRRITPCDENLLMLDYADVRSRHREMKGVSVQRAGEILFRENGFDTNPWDNSVQYKRRVLERAPSLHADGFDAVFRVEAASVPSRVRLAVERAEFYRLEVNGTLIARSESDRWLDKVFGVYDLTGALVPGTNEIMLRAPLFHPLLELEPVYLLGDFTVEPVDAGFRIHAGMPALEPGDWTVQGLPFYGGQTEFELEPIVVDKEELSSARFYLQTEGLHGAAARVRANGNAQAALHMGGTGADITALLSPGANRLSVIVSATQQNVWGPHHAGQPAKIASPWMWKTGPAEGPPPGHRYAVAMCGLERVELVTLYR